MPGVSSVYRGGVVAYDPRSRPSLLGVPEGPVVSEETAAAMAIGVCRVMDADVGIATTGVAGPDEMEGRPVGTVCMAVSRAGRRRASHPNRHVRLPGDRERIRQFSTITVLDMLRKML